MKAKIFLRGLSVLILIGSFSAGVFAVQTRQFTIQTITCEVGGETCPSEVAHAFASLTGRSLFFVNYTDIEARVLAQNPALSNPQVTKRLPHELLVHFDQLTPSYQLQRDDQFFQVEAKGSVIAVATVSSSLPVIMVSSQTLPNLAVHQQLNSTVQTHLVAMTSYLQEHPLANAKIVLDSMTDIHVELPGGKTAQLRVDQAESDIQKLEFVLSTVDFSHFKEPIKTIDVRFKYPVLKI